MNLCERFQTEDVVCPSHIRKGLFVVGAIDDIDHNTTSTSSLSSFHGTGISIIPFPDSVVNDDENNETTFPDIQSAIGKVQLPISYTTVPAVSLNVNKCQVPAVICDENIGKSVNDAVEQENNWIKHGMHELSSTNEHVEMITWAAFHANYQRPALVHHALTAMLPLFSEKCDNPAMIMQYAWHECHKIHYRVSSSWSGTRHGMRLSSIR